MKFFKGLSGKNVLKIGAITLVIAFALSSAEVNAEVTDNSNPLLSPLYSIANAMSSISSSLTEMASKESSSSSGGNEISRVLYFTGGGTSYSSYIYSAAVSTYTLSAYGITDYSKCDVEIIGNYEACVEAGNNSSSKYYTTYTVTTTAYITGGKLYVYGPCAAKVTVYK
ncbi:MAG: hypothetical protein K6G40_09260 [Eubacterium sp.]|nr:hypothetical protein [Eubacterium sp.]